MSSVILITSHLNNTEKINTILKHVKKIKEFSDLPIIHASNYYVNENVQKLFDYTVIKDNEKSNRYSMAWDILYIKNEKYKLIKKALDYGFSHVDLMLYGFKVCKLLNFDYVYHLNYDIKLDQEEFEKFINNGTDKNEKFYSYNYLNNNIKITTTIFSIRTNEFISAVESKLDIYRRGIDENLFCLDKGWLAEEFFEWIFNSYYGYRIDVKKINYIDTIRSDWDENKFEIDNCQFIFYSDHTNNRIIYINTDKKFTEDSFILTDNNEGDIKIEKYTDNFFVSEIKNGLFYKDEKFILEITIDKMNRYWSHTL